MCRLSRELARDERLEQVLDRFDIPARELAVDVHIGHVGDGESVRSLRDFCRAGRATSMPFHGPKAALGFVLGIAMQDLGATEIEN
jgi:hypothetical protein